MDEAGAMAGVVALYIVVEMIKWFLGRAGSAKKDQAISPEIIRKIHELHQWHNHTDEDGRKSWYVPRTLFREQAKMVEMLREISHNQETTARLLGEMIEKIEK